MLSFLAVTLELPLKITEDLCAIALRAGAAIMTIAESPLKVDRKPDQSPITAADQAANDVIVAALHRLTPTIPVVSEEGDKRLDEPDQPFWLVDPLDGTKEFIAGNGEFTVNIALIDKRVPILGVVYAPAIERLFFASGPGNAFQQRGAGQPIAINARTASPDAVVALASRSHLDDRTQAYLAECRVADIRQMGSSLKFCLIAAGEADLYPRFGPTMEWDTAAGHAVLAAAGGSVTTLDGGPFLYAKAGLKNPDFIARGAVAS